MHVSLLCCKAHVLRSDGCADCKLSNKGASDIDPCLTVKCDINGLI